jgi:hypothetical protein
MQDVKAALRAMLEAYAPNAEETAKAHGEASLHSAVRMARAALREPKETEAPAADWAGCCRASQRIWRLFNAMQKGTPADLKLAPTSTTAEMIASELGIALPGE